MTPRLAIQPLVQHDIDELEGLLRSEEVYRFIGGPPSSDDFQLGMSRAIAGPPPLRDTETWLNYGVRLQSSGVLIGRLEATVHDGVAEVAFLFGPGFWGKGYATEGLCGYMSAFTYTLSAPRFGPRLSLTTYDAKLYCAGVATFRLRRNVHLRY